MCNSYIGIYFYMNLRSYLKLMIRFVLGGRGGGEEGGLGGGRGSPRQKRAWRLRTQRAQVNAKEGELRRLGSGVWGLGFRVWGLGFRV